jgi:hypothetical protein
LFFDERAVLAKYLEAIVGAVAHVHQAIVRDAHGVNNPKLRRWRTIGIVLTGLVFMLHGAAERRR